MAIRSDKDDPFSRGHICRKAIALDVHDDPDRLRQPVRRKGREWEPVGFAGRPTGDQPCTTLESTGA